MGRHQGINEDDPKIEDNPKDKDNPKSRVEKLELKFCPKYLFLIFRKSQEVSFHYLPPK